MPLTDDLALSLTTVSPFKALPLSACRDIVAAGEVSTLAKGQIIFIEGEPCSGLYVLLRGKVHLGKISLEGQHSIISIVKPVIMFNEVATLDGGPNSMTAQAAVQSAVWHITREKFQILARRYPEIPLSLLPVLASRNRALLTFAEDVTFRTVLARTAKVLLTLSEKGTQIIDRRENPSHIMAARAATVTEPFCRAMRLLQHAGVLAYTRTSITVLDAAQLARIAGVDCD